MWTSSAFTHYTGFLSYFYLLHPFDFAAIYLFLLLLSSSHPGDVTNVCFLLQIVAATNRTVTYFRLKKILSSCCSPPTFVKSFHVRRRATENSHHLLTKSKDSQTMEHNLSPRLVITECKKKMKLRTLLLYVINVNSTTFL